MGVEVKREFVYELRNKGGTNTCTGIGQPIYYDIAIMELGRRIIYDYEKFGDSPTCIGEEKELPNQLVLLQGFGQQAKEGSEGELLELPLQTITNDECYEEFSDLGKYDFVKSKIRATLYEGITDQVLCTKTTCKAEDVCMPGEDPKTCLARGAKCDASPGDSGAPLFNNATVNEETKEKTGETLLGIHSGGQTIFLAINVQREQQKPELGQKLFPKWWVRVAEFADWIKCLQKHARDGLYWRTVERKCGDTVKYFLPKCNHS